jgi:DNA adenine methylase
MKTASPLRYPGGKWRLTQFFDRLLRLNEIECVRYVEPYAGGASLALSLLLSGRVDQIYLNDLDRAIYCFWSCVLTQTRELTKFVQQVPLTPKEWQKQKAIYSQLKTADEFDLGCATFFLNRTNHSGILNGGMIGGKCQSGAWRLDARFNRSELSAKIQRIAEFDARIHLSCMDAMKFVRRLAATDRTLIYLDPPYYGPGHHLYMNSYTRHDHATVRDQVVRIKTPWILSYDDVRPIRELYHGIRSRKLKLLHTARTTRTGSEVLYFSKALRIPKLV